MPCPVAAKEINLADSATCGHCVSSRDGHGRAARGVLAIKGEIVEVVGVVANRSAYVVHPYEFRCRAIHGDAVNFTIIKARKVKKRARHCGGSVPANLKSVKNCVGGNSAASGYVLNCGQDVCRGRENDVPNSNGRGGATVQLTDHTRTIRERDAWSAIRYRASESPRPLPDNCYWLRGCADGKGAGNSLGEVRAS